MTQQKITDYFTSIPEANSAITATHSDLISETEKQYKKIGFPSQKSEDWHYIDLNPILSKSWVAPVAPSVEIISEVKRYLSRLSIVPQCIFINGYFNSSLSTLSELDLTLTPLSEVDPESATIKRLVSVPYQSNNPFEMLNTMHLEKGALLQTNDGQIIEETIHIMNVTTGKSNAAQQLRLCLDIKADSRVSVAVHQVSLLSEPSLTNLMTTMTLAQNASVEFVNFKHGKMADYHFDTTTVDLQDNATFKGLYITTNTHFSRNEIRINCLGKGCHNTLKGLSILNDQEQYTKTDVEITVPECESEQLFKTILTGAAVSEYNGLIKVHRNAQKINSDQLNRNLILDDRSKAYSRPQLNILADDVKCTHGSTTGEIQVAELLYLQSRGLSESEARKMLLFGFAQEITQDISSETLMHYVDGIIKQHLQGV